MHVDNTKHFILEVDASNFALGSVSSQIGDDSQLHPKAFHTWKYEAAKINYEIHDKEFLVIVRFGYMVRYARNTSTRSVEGMSAAISSSKVRKRRIGKLRGFGQFGQIGFLFLCIVVWLDAFDVLGCDIFFGSGWSHFPLLLTIQWKTNLCLFSSLS